MLNIISRMGEISWLSSFKTVGGIKSGPVAVCGFKLASNFWMPSDVLVRCLSVLNVHFCKKSPKLAQMTFDRYLSNPDIGRTFRDGLTDSN